MENPKIRFKGFTKDWEQRKLGDVFEQTSNLVNPKEDEIELWSLTVEDGLTKKSDRYNREFLVKKDDNFKEVRPGDIVYNPMNMTLGAVGYNGMAKSVAVSGYYTTMVAKENYDTYYINTWLKSPQAIRLYRIYATGSLIEKQRVQFPTLSIIPVTFPKYEEQIKIGSYFHSIDNLITLHQRKCEQTKKLKKYMLQKMFPQNGAKVPEIRFDGFTYDWEQRKLIDYLEVSSEKNRDNRFTKEDVLSVSGEYGIVNQIEFQGRSFAGASVSNYGVVENGDVVYTKSPLKSNPYGIIKTNKGIPGIVSTLYAVYKPKEITDSKFVQIYFELDSRMNSYMHPLVNKGAKNDMKVSAENALKGMVSFPKKDEQEMISLYFSTLDNLITLHQRKCDELKKMKKYMLQNMFI